MYYHYKWADVYVIKKNGDNDFIFGPFNDEGDAFFMVEMLNAGRMIFSEDDKNGEEDA